MVPILPVHHGCVATHSTVSNPSSASFWPSLKTPSDKIFRGNPTPHRHARRQPSASPWPYAQLPLCRKAFLARSRAPSRSRWQNGRRRLPTERRHAWKPSCSSQWLREADVPTRTPPCINLQPSTSSLFNGKITGVLPDRLVVNNGHEHWTVSNPRCPFQLQDIFA